MGPRADADDAQGPLSVDDRLHGPRWHPWHADDVSHLDRAGESRFRLRGGYGSENRVALALQPVATALFASSPLFEGKPNGHKSWRSRIWRGLDDVRTGMLPFFFEEGMGYERYVDYVLDAPMYFVYRDGQYVDALGQSFRDFLKGELPAAGRKADSVGLGRSHDHSLP